MEMYTTEAIPGVDNRPILKAWLIHCTKGGVFDALAGLETQAAKEGADAVVGVRLTRVGSYYIPEVPFTVAGTTSYRMSSSGKTISGSCTAYGTAVKLLATSTDQSSEAARGKAKGLPPSSPFLKTPPPSEAARGKAKGLPPSSPFLKTAPPFWFAVPVITPLFPEDGGTVPVSRLSPGVWYLAVDVNEKGEIITQTKSGHRGVVRAVAGIEIGKRRSQGHSAPP